MLKKIKRFFVKICPNLNILLFESVPVYSDNARCVFEELIARGYNKKYKIVWKNDGKNVFPKIKNVNFININSRWGRILFKFFSLIAKCMISCNRFYIPRKKKQISIYLTHGTPIKSLRNRFNIPHDVNYCISPSQEMIDLFSYEFRFDKSKFYPTGLPRNDLLTNHEVDIRKMLHTDCEKIIIWYPTFRQHTTDADNLKNQTTLPIIHNIDSAIQLNEFAKKNNILIVLKPHFAQNLSYVKDLNLSNIKFITDDFYVENNISAYEFIGNCDALITDYSSIYFDYLICDKPIAAIWEDIEDYKATTGLIENYEYYMSGAEKVYNLEDFIEFLDNLSNGIDKLSEERKKINSIVNISNDGKNTQRVVDFIIEKANLKL